MTVSNRTRIGIGGWNFAPWRGGTFYPKGLPQAQELAFASRELGTIEINGTFYRGQSADTFRRWADQTPQDFIFSVKAHRVTTHRKLLADAKESVEMFVGSVVALGQKLGPILWQFAPTKKFDAEEFSGFLAFLPREKEGIKLRHVAEVRHESFCTPAFIDLLRRHEIAVCYTDSPKFPAIADLCSDFVYARLLRSQSNFETGYAPRDLDRWADRIRVWEKGGAPADLPYMANIDGGGKTGRDCFIYMIDGAKERAPAAATALAARLGSHEPPGE